ncbi:MAG: sensor histidine kinase [Pseudomonadota bacterium]
MNKEMLVVSLFVHDMKAPLAVIGSGATRLRDDMARQNYEAVGQTLVGEIIQAKKNAMILLNRILEMDTSMATVGKNPQDRSGTSLMVGFVGRIKSYFSVKEKTGPTPDLSQAIDNLKIILASLLNSIDALDLQASYSDIGRHDKTVLRRMRRNAKTALHFADNAIAILVSHNVTGRVEQCQIKNIVHPVMMEVFDLIDPDISEAIQPVESVDVLKRMLEKKQVYLNVDNEQWQSIFFCDANRLKQVLVNLLLNALKFRKQCLSVDIVMNTSRLVFSVTDDGNGIAKEDQPYIFKHRFQVKSADTFPIRGHGIGLAGAQALLESINGHLRLDSSSGRKTCFSAVLGNISEPVEPIGP